ncbi:jordan transposition protein [Volvox carteri f. nagariensis]|uniref:Jordan transposition protein n=1 Tax=Volvox carteri f. nagariensis TaxID=3068 RepID=D8UIQ8_VOLCA|nr:jordan transposition protein [Volvox carteri f. nagariensis]EFJ40399.1 jordan transposition protein [Volvox carteri f. nagariensis]|eukprot:XP_002958550.1 jordan transposition protein [Volvox carteri f. nagariensis]
MGPEASHRLVHIVPYDNFKEKRLTFASDWVAEEFTKRAWIDEQDQVKSLMEYSAKAVKGILFEKVMHGVLAMGGKFDVVPLHPETLERGEEEELDIQACTESLRFTDDEASDMMSSIKNMYLRPMSGNFPVIDALKVPEMHLFQMTISRSKVLNADELENVLKRLGIPAPGQEGCQPSLYFVVHSGVYNKFKANTGDSGHGCEGGLDTPAWLEPPLAVRLLFREWSRRCGIAGDPATPIVPTGLALRLLREHLAIEANLDQPNRAAFLCRWLQRDVDALLSSSSAVRHACGGLGTRSNNSASVGNPFNASPTPADDHVATSTEQAHPGPERAPSTHHEAGQPSTSTAWIFDHDDDFLLGELQLVNVPEWFDQEAAEMSRRLPGQDGAKIARRFMPVAFKPLTPDDAVQEHVLRACMHAIYIKHSSPACTESVVEAALDAKYHDYMSPGSSKACQAAAPYLPRTFKQALTLLSKYSSCRWPLLSRYDLCPCGFLFRCEHRDDSKCPGLTAGEGAPCGRERGQTSRSLVYNSIVQYLTRIYANAHQAAEFGSWLERRSTSSLMMDIADGDYVRQILESDQRFRDDPRNVLLMVVTDPFIVASDEHERSSTPWLLLCVNAPAHVRHEIGYASVLCIMGGNIKPPTQKHGLPMDHNHVLGLITDELEVLDSIGCEVHDASRGGAPFTCYAKIIALSSDYRGLQKHVGIKGTPALNACFKCWVHGHRVGHKTIFTNHFTWLSPANSLRKEMRKLHTTACGRYWPLDAQPPRPQSTLEMRLALEFPTATSCADYEVEQLACPLYRLRYFDPVLGIQYDGMHTIGGVIKDTVVKGLQGMRSGEASDAIREYDQGNKVATDAGKASSDQLAAFRNALASAANASPLTQYASRLGRLTGAGKAHKTHTMFLLAGPIGYYAIAAARLPATLEGVYLDLLQACGDLWDKAITR